MEGATGTHGAAIAAKTPIGELVAIVANAALSRDTRLAAGRRLCAIDPRRHRLGLRPEVLLSRPLGVAAFTTAATVRSVRWREAPRGSSAGRNTPDR